MKIPLRVLIIESVEENAVLLKRELRQGGYDPHCERVETAATLEAALQDEQWDLILAEIRLPDLSGTEALDIYKRADLDIPFIVVSGVPSEEAAVDSLKAGAHDFVSKDNLVRLLPAIWRELVDVELRRERAEVKQALFEKETMFETLMDAMSEGVCIIKNHRFINANPSLEKILGVEPGTLIGRSNREFLNYRKGEVRALREAQLQGRRRGSFELEITRPGGEKRQLLLTETPIPGSDEEDPRVFVVAYDITERKQMEIRLLERERSLQEAQHIAQVGNWEWDIGGNSLTMSEEMRRIFGFSPQDSFSSIVELIKTSLHPDDRSNFTGARHLISPQSEDEDHTYRIVKMDESVRWIRVTPPVVRTEGVQGTANVLLGTIQDVTSQRLTEEALEQRTLDLDGRVRELDCLYGITQYVTDTEIPLDKVIQDIVEHIPTGWHAPEQVCARIVIADSIYESNEFRETRWKQSVKLRPSTVFPGQIEIFRRCDHDEVDNLEQPRLEKGKALIEVIASRLSSYLEHRHITEQLQKSETRIRAITDAAREAIIILDAQGEVRYWNPAAEQLFGYTLEEIYGRSLHDRIIPERNREAFKKGFQQFKASDAGQNVNRTQELIGLHKNGEEIPCELSTATIVIDDEWQALGILRDVTERRKAEIKLQQANKMESIGTLAAGIAHEINTPTQFIGNNLRFLEDSFNDLNRVLASAGRLVTLEDGATTLQQELAEMRTAIEEAEVDFLLEEIPEAVQQSQRGVENVTRIVSSMRAFAHPGEDEKTPADLHKIIQDTVVVSRNEWKYVADLKEEFCEDLPEVPCYPGAFGQVILNLITNASHAIGVALEQRRNSESHREEATGTEKGLITIVTTRRNDCAEIRVSDTGTGIPASIQKRVFDPFFTTKDVGKGTGQGLSLAHSVIVENHGGDINFETEPGKGTTFIITLPIKNSGQEEEA